jgi:unsaturated chondroitin disaccharide hydrolase
MMNLELLFWASKETGDPKFYDIAVTHAETTIRSHFRPDNSSYHVISFDTITGEIEKKNTHQGYDHESAWSRGQAWGLYGFTMTYRETGDKKFLDQAKSIAEFILRHPNLPGDKVPYWDYDAPGQPDIPRDASAAAIASSALYELSGYCEDGTEKQTYLDAADQILASLASGYKLTGDHEFPFLLDHSTGIKPENNEVDIPIIYADYYFLEALLRNKDLIQK